MTGAGEWDVDARTAAVIAAGMRAVALADGEPHPRELALIEAFEADLPEGVDTAGVSLESPAAAEAFLRSLFLVAFADGRLGDAEAVMIQQLARAHGLADDAVEAAAQHVRMQMAYALAGEALDEA
jgi:tellurite resistance protein